ncbi:glycolipid 2-alpha-mannosyltransferase [Colletotrichum scovillei]|uniref:Glycolipid 2-alpha-mannosyltransferase n=2 Tax=Colletotrichum scovillei TaxID=1209932 RepID=A0A9P7QZ63_9PEZI|nr:glycolipid 2-alpha-mannosyltransferase [Colletotrichum scovillei]KAG7056567.1 glycolipid 2-alpha-mannosyltransferase [Colletotrichum scovillei]KAG7066465.1 glycolipid 2-alpha-mannosyltransferase [Colletotrichum scovillei]
MTNDDLPIALRRTRRSMPASAHEPSPAPAQSQTPRKAPKRRVRFSDPGPSGSTTPRTTRTLSTGLTPMINRTSLSRGGVAPTPSSSSSSRRRHSMPNPPSGAASDLPPSGEVHFLPLRQVLSGRVQRRIRRNGLSEEMNTITAEKRASAKQAKEQLQTLRDQLRQKDAEIYELQNATIILDTERIWALEKEVDDLRSQLADRSSASAAARQKSCFDWTLAARDPFADDFMETDTVEAESVCGERVQYADETVFGEATMAEMECSTPTRVRSSFLTPPLTSPVAAGPATPSSLRGKQRVRVSAPSDAGVQADFPDPEKKRLEEELASLRLEMSKLTGTLESYSALTERLSQKLAAIPPEDTASDYSIATIETQITSLLRTISDRTAALQDLNGSLCALGFPGSDGAEVVTSLSAALRTARLELEYLTPGEITLPLSSRGAEVLDLLLTRLRDLAKRAKEDEASIDEYHELELSLRQQLGARVAVMGELETELKRARKGLQEKDGHVSELEVSVERLKGAVAGYVRDISELEGVVGNMESENRDAMATKDAQVEVGRRVLRAKEDVIAKLETKLSDAVAQGRSLRKRLTEAEEARTKEVAEVTRRGGAALAVRDARVRELREELERVNAGLRAAHEGIKDLRVEKRGLEGEMVREREAAKGVIEGMRGELERVVGMSREFLGPGAEDEAGADDAGPKSGAIGGSESGAKRGLLAGDLARRSSGRKRRRYDSGLGFLEEDEVDA